MALDFPASPGPGQTFVAGGVTWTWDGAKWVFQGAAGSGVYLPLTGGTISGNLTVQGSTSVQALTCTSINGAPAVFPAMRNRLINGAMRVDQRNAGAAINGIAANTYSVDRWAYQASVAGKFNAGRNLGAVAPPAGFVNYLGFTTAAAYAVAATDYFNIFQGIEGLNTADLGWGAAGAQSIMLSFWARSSVAGAHSGALGNYAATRSYPFSFTLVANTWTYVTIPIPGDTAGVWASDNTGSIYVYFCLGAGATFRGAAGAWHATSGSVWQIGVTGGVNVVATLNATFQVTGVQLEAGSVATPFEWRHYDLDLALCQRYFQRIGGPNTSCVMQAWCAQAGANFSTPIGLTRQMRAVPTVTQAGSWLTSNAGSINYYPSLQEVSVQVNPPAAGGYSYYSLGGYLALSAEL